MTTLAARAGLRSRAFGLAIKTSHSTGVVTYFLSVPRRNWLAHALAMLTDVGCPAGATVYVDRPDRRGRLHRKEYTWG